MFGWRGVISVPASAFPASAEPQGVPHAVEQGAPPVPDEIRVAAPAAIRFAAKVPCAIPLEAQAATRYAAKVPGAIPLEVKAAILHESRERGEIRREAQLRPATLASVFPQEPYESQFAPPLLTWMSAILCEKVTFWTRVLSETRFVQMKFAIQLEKELFATRSL